MASEHLLFTLDLIIRVFWITTVVDILVFIRLLQSHFGWSIEITHFTGFVFPSIWLSRLRAVEFGVVFVEGLSFDKLKLANHTLKPLSEMYDLDMPIKMMLVAETHDAVTTSILFLVSMWDHVALEVWASLERFFAWLFFTDIVSAVRVTLTQMTIEVAHLFEVFATVFAGLGLPVLQVCDLRKGELVLDWWLWSWHNINY